MSVGVFIRMVMQANFLSLLLFFDSGGMGKMMGTKVEMEMVAKMVVEMDAKVVCLGLEVLLEKVVVLV